MRVGSENMENLMTVVDRLDELQESSVGRRECSSTRQRTGLPRLYQQCINSVSTSKTVKSSQKTVKQQKMTIGVPIVTCLHRVRRIHKSAQTPLPCETCITCAWAVATARRPWAGLTVCVYMDVHASGSRSLQRAATLSSTY